MGKSQLPPTLQRTPIRPLKTWTPNGGMGGGKSMPSFDHIISDRLRFSEKSSAIIDTSKVLPGKPDGNKVDLTRWGLLAAANTLGLSSPSMSIFLTGVKKQVAQEHARLEEKAKEEQRDTLGFVINGSKPANVVEETWIDCRDVMEEKMQQQKHTEMMETAVLLVVDLKAVPGQGRMDIKQLCRACDEARIRWGESASQRGLQLVRWSCTRWYLYSAICEEGLKHRPVVREVADCVLEMETAWGAITRDCGILLYSFSAGLVVGSLFASFNGGTFLSHLSGRAFDTACRLSAEAMAHDIRGCIMVTDMVVEALRHTHHVCLQGTNYRLCAVIPMPFNHNISSLIGSAADTDPVSPGPAALTGGPHSAVAFSAHTVSGGQTAAAGRQPARHLTVVPPSPLADSSAPGSSLIGYGPKSVVTPGSFGHPIRFEPNVITQPSLAHRHATSASMRRLQAGEASPGLDSPVHPPADHANTNVPATSFRKRPQLLVSLHPQVDDATLPRRSAGPLSLPLQTPVASTSGPRRQQGTRTGGSRHGLDSQAAAFFTQTQKHPQPATLRARCVSSSEYKIHPVTGQTARSMTTKLSAMQMVRQVIGSYPVQLPKVRPGETGLRTEAAEPIPRETEAEWHSPTTRSPSPHNLESPTKQRAGYSNLNVTFSPGTTTTASPKTLGPKSAALQQPPGGATLLSVYPSRAGTAPEEEAHPTRLQHVPSKKGTGESSTAPTDRSHVALSSAKRPSPRQQLSPEELQSDVTLGPLQPRSSSGPLQRKTETMDVLRVSKDCGSLRGAQQYVASIPTGTMVLNLSLSGLAEIPDISHLSYLEMLAASYNRLVSVPGMQVWAGLSKLQNLSLAHNEISSLPQELFYALPVLKELNLGANRLTEIPVSLWTLRNLHVLCLAHNRVTAVSPEVSCLVSLGHLSLAANQLTEIPEEISHLSALHSLDISANKLTALPESLAQLQSLVTLDASTNQLTQLPVRLMCGWTRLEQLSLAKNRLRSIWESETADLIQQAANAADAFPATIFESLEEQQQQHPSLSTDVTPRDWAGSTGSMASKDSQVSDNTMRLGMSALLAPREQLLACANRGSSFIAFPSLKVLNLDNNHLKHVPEWLPPELEELHMAFNRLVTLPDWMPLRVSPTLHLLSLHHNSIEGLPKSIRVLECVELIGLRDNPLVSPDAAGLSLVFNKGGTAAEIVKYMKRQPLRTLKLATKVLSRAVGQGKLLKSLVANNEAT